MSDDEFEFYEGLVEEKVIDASGYRYSLRWEDED